MKNLLAAIAMLAVATVSTAARADDQDVVTSFYTQLLSKTTEAGLSERMDHVLSPDWQSVGGYTGPVKTRAQFLAELQGLSKATPDLHWKIEEIIHAGDRYIVRGRATATPVLPFMGVAPAKRGFEIMSIDIHTVQNHQIVKSYHVEDWHGAIDQLQPK